MLVLVPVPIVYLGETDNQLAARSSYGTGYGLPVVPIAKFGVASPGFEFAQIVFQSGQGSRTNAGFWRAMTIQRARRQALIPIVQVAVTKIRRHQNLQQNRLLMRGSARNGKWIGADMKGVLRLTTFTIGGLCFVMFVTTVKPDAISDEVSILNKDSSSSKRSK
jgi:hypothetical protein